MGIQHWTDPRRNASGDQGTSRGQGSTQSSSFREGNIQVLVATEAAGEGINLQCCNILFNYDIPWNPNRLEQRMGASTGMASNLTA